MTELEKIERAKMYIDKLANGINPIDDSVAPDEDIINNVRLSRCFFFVSDILRQVIENGGTRPIVTDKKSRKLPLEISFEKRQQFDYDEKPLTASEIARRINDLADQENMKKFTYLDIVSWFTEIRMLEEVTMQEGKHTRRPTTLGRENGISVEDRISSNGPYQVVVYSTAAQHLILDNLDAILAMTNTQWEMQGMPWTKEQDDRLTDLYQRAIPLNEIAATLKRNVPAIRKRLKKLGLDVG